MLMYIHINNWITVAHLSLMLPGHDSVQNIATPRQRKLDTANLGAKILRNERLECARVSQEITWLHVSWRAHV